MKVIKCDQCSKIIAENETFILCTCNFAELIGDSVCSIISIIKEGSHFCTVGCAIDKLTQEWKEYNESH